MFNCAKLTINVGFVKSSSLVAHENMMEHVILLRLAQCSGAVFSKATRMMTIWSTHVNTFTMDIGVEAAKKANIGK